MTAEAVLYAALIERIDTEIRDDLFDRFAPPEALRPTAAFLETIGVLTVEDRADPPDHFPSMHATRLVESEDVAAHVAESIGSSWPTLDDAIAVFLLLAQERLIPVLRDEAFTPHPTDVAVMAAFVDAGYARQDGQQVIWTDKSAPHLTHAGEAIRGEGLGWSEKRAGIAWAALSAEQRATFLSDRVALIGQFRKFWNGFEWTAEPTYETNLDDAKGMAAHILDRLAWHHPGRD